MIHFSEKLKTAISRFDEMNVKDPGKIQVDGNSYPEELFFSIKRTEWVQRLVSDPSEELLLAVRSQHLRRWEIPRSSFPMTQTGYLQWRRKLSEFHADEAEKVLKEVGYSDGSIQKVRSIHLKKNIKGDLETQAVEDALCLVFLEYQFRDFVSKTSPEKMPRILKKSWEKMSLDGRAKALTLNFQEEDKKIILSILSETK